MGRLTEAIFMVNCTPKEWSKYSAVVSSRDPYMPDSTPYLTSMERVELKRLRKLYRNKK